MAGGCCEYNRGQAIRHAAAEAGRGLPTIEHGMPLPAGTGLSRRSFLLRSAGLAVAVYGGAAQLDERAVEEALAQVSTDGRVLVSVFLEGGVDGMSVLAPTGHSQYSALRPNLGLTASEGTPFSEDPTLRWHPAAEALATLHREGKLTVFPAIGYSSPNQSHFTSRHFWEVGALAPRERVGWLGRYLDLHGTQDNPLQGLTMGGMLMPALAASKVPVATVLTAHDYTLPVTTGAAIRGTVQEGFAELGALGDPDPATDGARTAARHTVGLYNQLAGFAEPTSPVPYPADPLAMKLQGVAAMLAAGLPIGCVSVQGTRGYDSHANQARAFANDFKVASDCLLAFQRDLEARGLADRVLVNVWSEFGRRPAENGSGGTDHGAGGIGFLIGTRARSSMVGEFPGLSSLDPSGNLPSTSDFRGLYCALLEQWLGVDAAPIIPGADGFVRPDILKA
jgi:uncharacterized protein (DUF1501 family)